MQDEIGNIMDGQNVFIEFEIMKESDPIELYKELDVLIATGRRIFVWSKTVPPMGMRVFCLETQIHIPEKEKNIHETAYRMRYEGSTYQEISEATGVPIKQLGWYISNSPNRNWSLDDWVADYYIKDSAVYGKVDAIIDCSERVVEKFKRRGIPGNTLGPLNVKNKSRLP